MTISTLIVTHQVGKVEDRLEKKMDNGFNDISGSKMEMARLNTVWNNYMKFARHSLEESAKKS